jgi:hypothetical protein
MSVLKRAVLLCLFAAVVVLAGSSLVGLAMTPGSVKAMIDSQCVPQPGFLVVPPGMIAKNFKISALDGGSNCATGMTIRERGFKIDDVFEYLDRQDGSPIIQKPVPLKSLQLGPGTYRVTVGGGRSAIAALTYELYP